MRQIKSNVALPIIGLDVGKPGEFIDARSTPDCKNIQIDRNVLGKRFGTTAVGASLGERVLGMAELQIGNDTYFVRIGPTTVELLNKTNSTWSDITGTALTANNNYRIDFAFPLLSGSKAMVFTNYIDAVRKYTGSGNTAALGGSPPKAKFCVAFGPYLILAYIDDSGDEFSSRLQWCDTGNIENWSSGNAGSLNLMDDPDDITGLGILGQFVTVHKKSSIYTGYLVSTSEVFRFDRKNTGVGAACFATIKQLPGSDQIFLSYDGFHIFNGITAPLIESAAMDELRESINPQYINKCWSVIVRERDEYWCGIPTGSDTEPNTVYKYNYRTGQLYKDERTNICAAALYEKTTQISWNEKLNTWNSDTTLWNNVIYLALNPVVALGDSSGLVTIQEPVYNDNGSAISSYWVSKDFTAQDLGDNDLGRMVRWNKIQVWAKGSTLNVQYSTDSGLNWIAMTPSTLTLSADYPSDSSPLFAYFDVVSSKIRFKFANATELENWQMKKFTISGTMRELIA